MDRPGTFSRSPSLFRLSCLGLLCAVFGAQAEGGGPAQADTLTAVEGIRVGSHTLSGGTTGCTVVVVEGDGAPGGVAQRGGAPGTRETDALDPLNMVDKVDAIVLSGGSAFGLDSASGTVRWLREHNRGWDVGVARVPIVSAAVLFDLPVGENARVQPDADCGYRAAEQAGNGPVVQGSVGAGAGATVGKFGQPMRGGLGSFAYRMPNGLVVGALVATNALGDIVDPENGRLLAGARDAQGRMQDVRRLLRDGSLITQTMPRMGENTTIGVVATNARLSKAQVNRLALMADDGYGRAIHPVHTMYDGDTVFALATGRWEGEADLSLIGALAADAMAQAVKRAVLQATALPGIPAARDVQRHHP